MRPKLSDEIRYCYERAEECLRRAQGSVLPEQCDAFAQVAKNWMTLAQSYEFAERLTDFTNENRRRLDSLADPKLH